MSLSRAVAPLLWSCAAVLAQETEPPAHAGAAIEVLGADAPAAAVADLRVTADAVYGHKLGLALTYDMLEPPNKNGIGVLWIVSGGWRSTWSPPERFAVRCRELLARGFAVFAVRHGSSPMFAIPEIVADVRRAVRCIRLRAREHGVDPERLGVFGGSAGGQLALVLGTTADDGDPKADDPVLRASNRVAAVAVYYPPTDLRSMVSRPGPDGVVRGNTRFPALDFDPELADDFSPLLHATQDDAPSLLIHGDRDRLVPLSHSENMRAAFGEHDVACELLVIEGAGHGFRGADAERAQRAVADWFERHLRDGATGNRRE